MVRQVLKTACYLKVFQDLSQDTFFQSMSQLDRGEDLGFVGVINKAEESSNMRRLDS